MLETVYLKKVSGFSLIEMMIAMAILTFGLLAVGPLLYIVTSSASLARSKDTAAVAAQDTLEILSDLYARIPSAEEFLPGIHGPQQTQVINPADETVLNWFDLTWTVSNVPDPRPGKVLDAKRIRVTVTPIQSGGARNIKPAFNKVLQITTILSPKMP